MTDFSFNLESAHSDEGVEWAANTVPTPLFSFGEYLEGTSDCVFILDDKWRFTYLNERAQAEIANGRNLVGQSLWEAFVEKAGSLIAEHLRRAMTTRTPASFEAP